MGSCYCPDCAYSEYDPETDLYYCGIDHRERSGADSANCSNYNEK
jgi:hypothetical protein